MRKKRVVTAALGFILAFAGPAGAEPFEPIEALKGPVEEGLRILRDPRYRDPSMRKAQRDRIWEILDQIFDYAEISRRALGANWKAFSPAEQEEFTDVFSRLIGNTYLDRIQGEFQDEKVEFLDQEMVEGKPLAKVSTRVVRKAGDIPVDYGMVLKEGRWQVYDVRVEGVSLVQNYRSQFSSLLVKETPAQLIERIRAKNAGKSDSAGS